MIAQGRVMRAAIVGAVSLIPMLLVSSATVRYTGSDSYGVLLVADQLGRSGTLTLDAFGPEVTEGNWRTALIHGQTYYNFPVGTSVLLVPAVRIATEFGVQLPAQEQALQVVLAAGLASITLLLLYALARRYLGWKTSLLLALTFWLGTSISSTNGTALWSHNLAVILGTGILLLLATAARGHPVGYSLILGVVMFSSYLVRPTMALVSPFALGYLWLSGRRLEATWAAGTLVTLATAFVSFSLRTFGSPVPPYYGASRLSGWPDALAEAGLLFSPSRGLLLYTPILLVLPLLAYLSRERLRQQTGLLTVCLGWIAATFLVLGSFDMWYGGAAFGPRLLTDVIPAFFLVTVLLWPTTFVGPVGKATLALVLALALVSVAIHTGQGLFNRATLDWNFPQGRHTSEVLWDWSYPQLLHTELRQRQRDAEWAAISAETSVSLPRRHPRSTGTCLANQCSAP